MAGLRTAIHDLVMAVTLSYGAFNLIVRGDPAQPTSLLPVLGAVAPGLLPANLAPDAGFALLAMLDVAALLALAALAFLLLAGAARAVAPRRAFPPRQLAAALAMPAAPLFSWIGACRDAAGGIAAPATARDAALAFALGAYAAYAVAYVMDAMMILTPHPNILLAAIAALLAAPHAPALHPDAYAVLRVLDTLTFLSAYAALPLLAMVVLKATLPACARLWRRL